MSVEIFKKRINVNSIKDRCFLLDHTLKSKLNIEKIFVINLKNRIDRLARFDREMVKFGVEYKIIDGINGLNCKECFKLYLKFITSSYKDICFNNLYSESLFNNFKTEISPNVFAYILSQKVIFEESIKNSYENILIFDDDVFFTNNAILYLNDFAKKNKSFSLILLGSSEYAIDEKIKKIKNDDNVRYYQPKSLDTCGSFAVIYNKKIYNEILINIEKYIQYGPYDNIILGNIYNRYKEECFVINPTICVPDITNSDIRDKKREQIAHSQKMHWDIERFDEFTEPIIVTIIIDNFDILESTTKTSFNINNLYINIMYISRDGILPIFGEKNINDDYIPLNLSYSFLRKLNIPFSYLTIIWKSNIKLSKRNISDQIRFFLMKNQECFKYKNNLFLKNFGKYKKINNSIIIYYEEDKDNLLLESLTSALLQTNNNFEIIIINNSFLSNNKIKDFISKKIGSKYLERIKLYKTSKKRTTATCLNIGIYLSSGRYISFLDIGNIYRLDRFSIVENYSFVLNKCSSCFFGDINTFQNYLYEGDYGCKFLDPKITNYILASEFNNKKLYLENFVFKYKTLQLLNGFDPTINDYFKLDLIQRIILKFKILFIDNIVNILKNQSQKNIISLDKLKNKGQFVNKYIKKTDVDYDLVKKTIIKNYFDELKNTYKKIDFNNISNNLFSFFKAEK